jgi:scaffold protein (connect acetoacetyl-CoA thiolase and HMG-CoA synthase)
MAVPRFWREQPQRYRLVGTECPKCKDVYFPPRSVCPECRRESVGKMRPRQLSGRGKILTFTVVHQPADGFEMQVPYVMAIVELEEGCRVMTQIVNAEPAAVRSGLPVEACFRRIREDGRSGVIYYGYKFRPVRTKAGEAADVVVEARPRRRRA